MQKIINLDQAVLNALHLFADQKLPSLKLPPSKRPFVVGSGNAAITGKILFQDADAVFADESTYLQKLNTIKNIDGCILISASGGKHAPIVAKELNKRKKKVILLTTNVNAPAREYVDEMVVFPKQSEPYTYNTSTYLGMILSKTKENPSKIIQEIKKIKILQNLKCYDAFFIIVPPEFELIREMFLTKFDELFGAKISARVFTFEQAKHAKTVVPSERELFISFGYDNTIFGKHRWNIALPKEADYGLMMALGYYVIGQIQQQHPPYFKQNIERYCKEASKMFGERIGVMVG
ncbi:MAG TPA: hypothetical protein VJI32_04630 [Candidatus Nanoarchaeia archaeon]|nr:hypothetical protein [Candidatus Nanoarchaeia archaeon]